MIKKTITEYDSCFSTSEHNLVHPAFADCDHCIVFCTDENYTALTAVAIQSIVDQAKVDEYYDILIFHGGISNENIDFYLQQWNNIPNVSIRFVNLSSLFDGLTLYTENREHFSREAYFRLVTPWVVSEDYKTALYLDGDMILRNDVSNIFHTELKDKLLAAVKDYWGICNCYIKGDPRRKYRLSIGLTDIDNYVISATLLFNLRLWRERFTAEQIVNLCASREWEQHDQDVVNILCKGSIVYLSPTWGMMEDYGNNHYLPDYLLRELDAGLDPVIAHFGGLRKPYLEEYVKFDLEFWSYADKTPYMNNLLSRVKSDEYRSYIVYAINKNGIQQIRRNKTIEIYYKDVYLGALNQAYQRVRVIRINNATLHIEGAVGYFGSHEEKDVTLELAANDNIVHPTRIYEEKALDSRHKGLSFGVSFVFDYPLDEHTKEYKVTLISKVNGEQSTLSQIEFHQFAELTGSFECEYYTNDGWTIRVEQNEQSLIVIKNRPFTTIFNEIRFLGEMIKTGSVPAKKALFSRTLAHILSCFHRRPIWLISDRMDRADDNGEVFFKYLTNDHKRDVNAYFLLTRESKDYDRLSQIGRVIIPYSWRHKILALMAEWSISSQIDYVYRDPFRDYGEHYRNLLRKTRFVFMQHGVISNDMSRLLDKDMIELDGFVTSTNREYKSVLEGNYHYTDKEVWLTGLPRFDGLVDKSDKIITLMPTWRAYLFTGQDHDTGIWSAVNDFEESEYVRFYRDLLNDDRLKEAASSSGYSIYFMVHPTCRKYVDAFKVPDYIELVTDDTSYSEIYGRSSLIITDYSSSIYDFIYLRKPVVYCQFDSETMFSGSHVYDKGEFDYERDGFGEVTYTKDSLFEVVDNYLKDDCKLHEPYKTRIENAFPDREPTHCEKLYNKIIEQGKY